MPATGTRRGGTLPRPPAVLDQPQLPTLLRLKVRWPGFLDPVLVRPGLECHCHCATGEGWPSRVHPGTTATAAVLGRTRLVLAIINRGRLQAGLVGKLPLRPFRHVESHIESHIEGRGHDEADVLPQPLRGKSLKE